ncbi:MAG TPA: hypothetical protein VF060_21180 [Trebonia sp.]
MPNHKVIPVCAIIATDLPQTPHGSGARQALSALHGQNEARYTAAFGDDPQSLVSDQFAHFALTAIDGAFVTCQTDRGVTLEGFPAARSSLVASPWALLAIAGSL